MARIPADKQVNHRYSTAEGDAAWLRFTRSFQDDKSKLSRVP